MLVRLLQRGASGGARIPHCAFASTSPPLLAPYKKPPSSTDAAFSLDSLLDESGPDAPVKKGARRPARGPPGRPLPRPLPAAVTRPPPADTPSLGDYPPVDAEAWADAEVDPQLEAGFDAVSDAEAAQSAAVRARADATPPPLLQDVVVDSLGRAVALDSGDEAALGGPLPPARTLTGEQARRMAQRAAYYRRQLRSLGDSDGLENYALALAHDVGSDVEVPVPAAGGILRHDDFKPGEDPLLDGEWDRGEGRGVDVTPQAVLVSSPPPHPTPPRPRAALQPVFTVPPLQHDDRGYAGRQRD